MIIHKFGGASLSTIDRIKQTGAIAAEIKEEQVLIVISAMGKTTNALEKVAEAFFNHHKEEALMLFTKIKEHHLTIAKYLLVQTYNETERQLADFFTEIEWLLHDEPVKGFDYYYDQIVCIGELLSSAIVSAYFREEGIPNTWIDVRDILRTDDKFREAAIDWEYSLGKVKNSLLPLLADSPLLITQGFIAATDENESTTLGREGSDYSAAVFANMLDAESVTIWKDVEGVLNADPREFPEATLIPALNYREVIEMAYYGAQVIHPKTIKPLQNKNIPMYVKCFLDPGLPGTLIHNKGIKGLPPIIVVKKEQVLMELSSKDFSFTGDQSGTFYQLFHDLNIRPNLTQNGAISFICLLDDYPEKTEQLALSLLDDFEVQIEKGLTLFTVRHYHEDLTEQLQQHKQVVLKQQTPETIRIVVRSGT